MYPPRSSTIDASGNPGTRGSGEQALDLKNGAFTIIQESAAWFCVQTQQKREHIAASQLRQDANIEVFLPRIRYRRSTRSGPAWTTEALFPGYLFSRFCLATQLRRVRTMRGVRNVVHFGDRWPTIPDAIVTELQSFIGNEEIKTIGDQINPGDTVEVAAGVFHGFQAMVARVAPRRQRVSVLLDFLGRQTTVELHSNQLVRSGENLRASLSEQYDAKH